MREIKFRAWNVVTKKMIDLKKITPFALNMETDGLFIPFSDGLLIMQFTGLKDIFGKEIYENDIVRGTIDLGDDIDYNFTDTIIFKDGAFCCDKADFELKFYDQEVIGNVHENPELMEARSE